MGYGMKDVPYCFIINILSDNSGHPTAEFVTLWLWLLALAYQVSSTITSSPVALNGEKHHGSV